MSELFHAMVEVARWDTRASSSTWTSLRYAGARTVVFLL